MKKIIKQLKSVIILLAVGFFVLMANHFGLSAPEEIEFTKNDNSLDVYVLDVGQGDSIFIEDKNDFQILIDAGPDNSVIDQLGKVMDFKDNKIDWLILSHPHADHVGGFPEVLNRYDVDKIFLTGVSHTSYDYIEFLEKIDNKNIETEFIDGYELKELESGVQIEFLAPLEELQNEKISNLNNSSIINRITYNGESIMLTGDAEYEEESSMFDYYSDDLEKLKAGLYKVGHHGSKTASSYEFLNAMQAEIGLISCGVDNQFYHPHPSLLKKLEQKELDIFRTDEQGIIHCWTIGDPWQCETEK